MANERLYTICAFTENSPGVLHRITVIFTRRKLNIESLTVCETEQHGVSRFTICIKTDENLVKTVAKQINRIVEVVDVFVAENKDLLYKEIAFFRIATPSPDTRIEIERLIEPHDAKITLLKDAFLVVEKTGDEEEIRSLYLLLEPFGIQEFVRSGRIAILKRERSADYRIIENGI